MKFNIKKLVEAAQAVLADEAKAEAAAKAKFDLELAKYDERWERVCRPKFIARRDALTKALAKGGRVSDEALNTEVKARESDSGWARDARYAPPKWGGAYWHPGAREARQLIGISEALEGETVSLSALRSVGFTGVPALMKAYAEAGGKTE